MTFLPKLQRSVIIKDFTVTLNENEGGNESMRCPIAAPIKLFSTLKTNQRYSAFKPIAFVTVTLITHEKRFVVEILAI